MSKAKRIMALYNGIRTTREIADIVGCRPEYVRVVARQRMGTSYSDIDRRYLESSLGRSRRKERYRENCEADPQFRKKRAARVRERYHTEPAFRKATSERNRRYYMRKRAAEARAQ